MYDVIAQFRELQGSGALSLPFPGAGATAERHRRLLQVARENLSLARLMEAHCDALAILDEARRIASPKRWYGVWASDGPGSRVDAHLESDGSWRLSGVKQYCSGAPYLDTALVSAHCDGAVLLFSVDLTVPGIVIAESSWKSSAFADTATGPVHFESVHLAKEALVGGPNFYLNRPGFWHGALGPAACWAGGACHLIDAAGKLGKKDPHALAHIGALKASDWGLFAILDQAGNEIDSAMPESVDTARRRALKVRHLIERQCTEVLDRFGRATGPQLLAYDDVIGKEHQALGLYIRQCHGERDLAGIPMVECE